MEAFKSQVNRELSALEDIAGIQQIDVANPDVKALLSTLSSSITALELTAEEIRRNVHAQQQEIVRTETAIESARQFNNQIKAVRDSLPPLAQLEHSVDDAAPSKTDASVEEKEKTITPVLEYITADEFAKIPSYLKGRATITKVNQLLDEVQATVERKYKLLGTAGSQVRKDPKQWKLYKQYKAQQFPTDGEHQRFFSAQDLSIGNDHTSKSYLSILRFFKRIVHTSEQGVVRYRIVDTA